MLCYIRFTIMRRENVSIDIYNILGQKVYNVLNRELPVGKYKVHFDASMLASGLYFYQLEAGNFIDCKKMLLLK
jgi:hypothetical protein